MVYVIVIWIVSYRGKEGRAKKKGRHLRLRVRCCLKPRGGRKGKLNDFIGFIAL